MNRPRHHWQGHRRPHLLHRPSSPPRPSLSLSLSLPARALVAVAAAHSTAAIPGPSLSPFLLTARTNGGRAGPVLVGRYRSPLQALDLAYPDCYTSLAEHLVYPAAGSFFTIWYRRIVYSTPVRVALSQFRYLTLNSHASRDLTLSSQVY